MTVPPKAASKRRTTWNNPALLTMTCCEPLMMLNLLGAVAFLSSSPMVGEARAAAAWGCSETRVRQRLLFAAGALWPAGLVWLSNQLPSAGG